MLTFIITRDGKEVAKFTDQENDFKPFQWLLRNQGSSVHKALKHEGYKVEEINQETGTSEFWQPYN